MDSEGSPLFSRNEPLHLLHDVLPVMRLYFSRQSSPLSRHVKHLSSPWHDKFQLTRTSSDTSRHWISQLSCSVHNAKTRSMVLSAAPSRDSPLSTSRRSSKILAFHLWHLAGRTQCSRNPLAPQSYAHRASLAPLSVRRCGLTQFHWWHNWSKFATFKQYSCTVQLQREHQQG